MVCVSVYGMCECVGVMCICVNVYGMGFRDHGRVSEEQRDQGSESYPEPEQEGGSPTPQFYYSPPFGLFQDFSNFL